MRLETLPILIGALAALAGLLLVADALLPDGTFLSEERRRRPRAERNTVGEATLGVGLLLIAAALIGRDQWRYGTLSVLVAFVLFLIGVALNWRYVRGLMFGIPAGGPPADDPRG